MNTLVFNSPVFKILKSGFPCKIFVTIISAGCLLFLVSLVNGQCLSSKPTGLFVDNITSCQATLHWRSCSGAVFYKVRYKTSATWSDLVNVDLDTSYVIDGLSPGKAYTLAVGSFCSNTARGTWNTINFATPVCSVPVIQNIHLTDSGSVTIDWSGCGSPRNGIRYRPIADTSWILQQTGTSQSVNLDGLTGTYVFQVSSCRNRSLWSAPDTFTLTTSNQRPNILLIVLDDARWDAFGPNGGPSFFNSPNINRIADEGINFKLTIPATSQCGPSRASIYTGLYPHHHGLINNVSDIIDTLPLVQKILRDHGYFTGFVGKYGQGEGTPKGFDWWAESNSDNYVDPPYVLNGRDSTINGNILDVYPQLALTFLNKVPVDSPFCLMYFTRAPHSPTIPRSEDLSLYLTDTIPFPTNFYPYRHDYPSFFYPFDEWTNDSSSTINDRLAEFQTLAGVEDNVRMLLSYLDQKGVLDNTLIIFTSDNGFLKGEHMLSGKQIAQEESILVPLFIRYPKWFHDSTIITNQFASNIDIAPTLLEAAGIPDTFNMDGHSLHLLATGDVDRPEFFYEFGGQGKTPPLRAVRSLQYKFVHHFCSSTTEEFYDLVNDPHENKNLINDVNYSSVIESYRLGLDQLRSQYGDTLPITSISCQLKNPSDTSFVTNKTMEDGRLIQSPHVKAYPNPAFEKLTVEYSDTESGNLTLNLYDAMGIKIIQNDYQAVLGLNTFYIDVSKFLSGNYLLELQTSNEVTRSVIIISR